jgi:hypothetical protein
MYSAGNDLLDLASTELGQCDIDRPTIGKLRMRPPEKLAHLLVVFPHPAGHGRHARQALGRRTMSRAQATPALIARSRDDAISKAGPFGGRSDHLHDTIEHLAWKTRMDGGVQVCKGPDTASDGSPTSENSKNVLVSNHRQILCII